MATDESEQAGGTRKRVRIIFDTTEELRSVLQFRAWKDDVDQSDVVNEALKAYLAENWEEAHRAKGARGRKRKDKD